MKNRTFEFSLKKLSTYYFMNLSNKILTKIA